MLLSTMIFSCPKKILQSLSKTHTLHLLPAPGLPHGALHLRGPPSPGVFLRKPSLESNFKAFPLLQVIVGPMVQPESLVSFLHFPHKGVLSSGTLRHGSFEDMVFQHYFLVQPTSPKNEGTFQELTENAHPSLPSVLIRNMASLKSKHKQAIDPHPARA